MYQQGKKSSIKQEVVSIKGMNPFKEGKQRLLCRKQICAAESKRSTGEIVQFS